MMKKHSTPIVRCALAAVALCTAGLASAQTSVGVSIGINQPGVYGRINIGNYPQPVLVAPQPVIIAPPPAVAVVRQPIYLYVPEPHRLHWAKYCGRYAACGQPVLFVQERWVRETWERERHDNGRHRGWDKDKDNRGHGRGHDRDEHRRDDKRRD